MGIYIPGLYRLGWSRLSEDCALEIAYCLLLDLELVSKYLSFDASLYSGEQDYEFKSFL